MGLEQRIKQLKDTDHSVVKWFNKLDGSKRMYYSGYAGGFETVSHRMGDAVIYDMEQFAENIPGYTLTSITKKELFKAILKDK